MLNFKSMQMAAPGLQDELGIPRVPQGTSFRFQIPTVATGGTTRDMGTLALFLVANWFVNGETVLIDGGVSLLRDSSWPGWKC